MPASSDRRDFLGTLGVLAGGAWLSTHLPATAAAAAAARESGAGFTVLTPAEGTTLEALADRILPGGETPGAVDAGAIWFIDAAMKGFMAGALPGVRGAAADLDGRARGKGAADFASLSASDRDALMPDIAQAPWFGLMHLLTMAGVMSLPEHGGNRGHAGWKLIGFEHQHAWQPPFGAYDNQPVGDDSAEASA